MKHLTVLKIPVLLRYVLFLTTIGALTSCEDHREEIEPTRFRLKKTVMTSAYRADTKDTTTILYVYDAKGKLSSESSVFTSTYGNRRNVSNTLFTYDAQNRLIRIDTKYNMGYEPVDRIEYAYDTAGNIIVETKSTDYDWPHTGNYLVMEKTEFTYDGYRFPSTATNSYGTKRYTYLNGNISSIGTEYDDKPNPYYGVIRSGGIQSSIFNVNNQRENLDTDPKRIVTYNSLGLLVRLNNTYKPSFPYNYDDQTVFEYEVY